jgi:tRNA A-37 threonylcarbamoyl transferase component Bud32
MGHQWSLSIEDSRARRWIGEHRPELIDLMGVFARLVEMQPGETLPTEQWRAALPPHVTLVRLLGPRTAHVHVREAKVPDLVIKLCLPNVGSRWRRLTETVRHSRSHRAYLWAHRLRALGIDTPRPLGFIEREEHPALDKSFTVSEYIFAPTLTELRDEQLAPVEGRRDALLEKRTLIRRVAELVRDLHERGLFHGDLHAGNLLVAERSILLIDLDSMRSSLMSPKAPIKNLLRLNRDFLDTARVSRADRMRFLDVYLAHSADRVARRRGLFERLAAETEEKLKARGESFWRGATE